MDNKLLIETRMFTPQNVSSDGGNMVVEGILATAEIKNGNGRYYPRKLWEREFNKYNTLIQERRAVGELDHPETSVINLKNVSHIITEYWWDGDNIMGRIEILQTPSGKILQALIKSDVAVGVSSRGMGSIQKVGDLIEVQDDFDLACFDFVSTPSNPGSWMKLIKENQGDNSKVNILDSKYSKINEIITEILCTQTGVCAIGCD